MAHAQSPDLTVVGTVNVGLNPHQIAFGPEADKAFVAVAGSDRVMVVDTDTYEVRWRIRVSETPLGVAVLNRGFSIAVTRFGADRMARVGSRAGAVLDEIETGGGPSLIVGPLPGYRFLVSSEQANRLLVVDGSGFEVTASIPVGARPFPPAATSDGRLAMVPAYDDGTVSAIDLATEQTLWTVEVGERPSGGAVLPGDTIYAVAVRGDDRLGLIDLRTGQVTGYIEDGVGEGPFSVVVSPRLRVAFVNNTASHDVSVLDLRTLRVIDRVPVPELPIVMAGAPAGGTLWVSSEGDDLLTILEIPPGYRAVAPQTPTTTGTDIWVADLIPRDGWVELGAVTRVTDRPGYDNQPHLLPGGQHLLYTSVDQVGQADIWQADLETGVNWPFTNTSQESEYSATLMPDGNAISVIRVEADSTQRLWQFDMSGQNPMLLVPDVAPVGYQAWIDEQTVGVFVLGDPPSLQVLDLGSGQRRVVAHNVGRSLHAVPGMGAVSFVEFDDQGEGTIRAVDGQTGTLTSLTTTRPGSQDYAWTPSGVLLMAEGSMLYQWTAAGDWRRVADLGQYGLSDVTRLAVSSDGGRLALVANR